VPPSCVEHDPSHSFPKVESSSQTSGLGSLPVSNSAQWQAPISADGPQPLSPTCPTPWLPTLGLPVPAASSVNNSPTSLARDSSLPLKKFKRRRRNQLRPSRTAPKTLEGLAADTAREIRVLSNGNREVEEKFIPYLKAMLWPRKRRTANSDTVKAAEWLIDGRKWSETFPDILGGRYKYKPDDCKKLRRNAKLYVRKIMRQQGAPASMSIPDWIAQEQRTRSPLSPRMP
jgi:hypothetical protein